MAPTWQDETQPQSLSLAAIDAKFFEARSIFSDLIEPCLELQRRAQLLVDTEVPVLEQEIGEHEQNIKRLQAKMGTDVPHQENIELLQQRIEMAQKKIQTCKRDLSLVTERVQEVEGFLSLTELMEPIDETFEWE